MVAYHERYDEGSGLRSFNTEGYSRSHERKRSPSISASAKPSTGDDGHMKKLGPKKLRKLRDAMLREKFGYTNESNPFNDANLSAPFVWKKKVKFLEAAGRLRDRRVTAAAYLEQTERKIIEIESVKKRREEREEEERLLEQQQAMLARERELENYAEWEQREEAFHREMALRRTDIRIHQGRQRLSDIFAKALRILDGEVFQDLWLLPYPPHVICQKMNDAALAAFWEDVQVHYDVCLAASQNKDVLGETQQNWARSLERTSEDDDEEQDKQGGFCIPPREALAKHFPFWEALRIITAEELKKRSLSAGSTDGRQSGLQRKEGHHVAPARDVNTGIATVVLEDLEALMLSKTERELQEMEKHILKKRQAIRQDVNSQEDLVYWDAVYERLPYYFAVARCRATHQEAEARTLELRRAQRQRRFIGSSKDISWKPEDSGEAGEAESKTLEHKTSDSRVREMHAGGDTKNEDTAYTPDEAMDCSEKPLKTFYHSSTRHVRFFPPLHPPRIAETAVAKAIPVAEAWARRQTLRRRLVQEYALRQKKEALSSRTPGEEEDTHRLGEAQDTPWSSGKEAGRSDQLPLKDPPRAGHLEPRKDRPAEAETARPSGGRGPPVAQLEEVVNPFLPSDNDTLYEQFVAAQKREMGENESVLGPSAECSASSLQRVQEAAEAEAWDSRFRPRKPRFFNRVKTGYEWSKYNQTHYDRDNPPPKAVQGYKFNVFYPDLIDRTKAPSWKLLPGDSPETVLIQFHAGPPYEDIVFKIINREWELNPRTGFRNTFDRGAPRFKNSDPYVQLRHSGRFVWCGCCVFFSGILQLHFNFKRYRYRR